MRRASVYIFALIGVLNVTVAMAQKELPPPGGPAKDFVLPAKKLKSYPNGLRTTLVKYGNIPKVSIQLIIKTGKVHEAANQVWLASLTGDMIRQGTTRMDFKTISKKVAGMGGEVNIYVGMDQTSITGSVLSEYAPDFIKIIADLIQSPAFPASELNRLKDDLKRSLNVDKNVPQSQAQAKFVSMVYKNHPYGRYFPTEAMIDSYTLQHVKNFYNKNFGAKRSVLYVVGNYDEEAVNTAIDNAFSKWKPGLDVMYPPVTASIKRDTAIIDRKAAPQTTLMIGGPVIMPKDKNYASLTVTNSLLGGSFGSRITSNIRENKGYTYSPYSYIQQRQGTSLWIETADVTSEHTIESLQEIEKEIARLQNEPPSKDELDGIQNYEAGTFVLRNSSPDGIISQLNFVDRFGLDDNFLANLVKNIYKVTPDQVSQMAKDHFKRENMTVIMVGDKDSVQKQIKSATPLKKAF